MKKLLLTMLLAGASASVFAQGTLNFSTLLSATSAGTNRTASSGGAGPTYARASGAGFLGQLYIGAAGIVDPTALATNITVGPATFNTGGQAGYITGGTRIVTGFGNGATITVQVRAWNSAFASWEAAPDAERTALSGPGAPNLIQVTLTVPPATPVSLTGLQGFNIGGGVPEPSSIALGLLGLGAVALFRRRK